MPAAIDEQIRRKVVQRWINGFPRDTIAEENNIGAGTVSSIISNYKAGLEELDFNSIRQLAVEARQHGLNLSELALRFRLFNYFVKSEASEEKVESFIANVHFTDVPPEKVVECVNQLYDISKSESIPLQQVSEYIKKKLEENQKIDRDINEANDILRSKKVTIEAINEHMKLMEELDKHGISTQDIDKLLNLLLNAKEYGFEAKKIVGKLNKMKRLEKKEKGLENNCTMLANLLEEHKEIVPLAQKIVAMNIDMSELLVLDNAVNEIAKRYDLPPSVAAFRLFNDINDYKKIGGLKKELSRLCQQILVINGVWANQNKAMMAILNLQSRGITQDRVLYLNNILENNGYKDVKSNSTV